MCTNTEAKSLVPAAGPHSFRHCANIELKMLCVGQRTEDGQKLGDKELEIEKGSLLLIVI